MDDLSKETLAAYDYVDRVVDTADDKVKIMWHGWALRDAFVAGAAWQSAQQSVQRIGLWARTKKWFGAIANR